MSMLFCSHIVVNIETPIKLANIISQKTYLPLSVCVRSTDRSLGKIDALKMSRPSHRRKISDSWRSRATHEIRIGADIMCEVQTIIQADILDNLGQEEAGLSKLKGFL